MGDGIWGIEISNLILTDRRRSPLADRPLPSQSGRGKPVTDEEATSCRPAERRAIRLRAPLNATSAAGGASTGGACATATSRLYSSGKQMPRFAYRVIQRNDNTFQLQC